VETIYHKIDENSLHVDEGEEKIIIDKNLIKAEDKEHVLITDKKNSKENSFFLKESKI